MMQLSYVVQRNLAFGLLFLFASIECWYSRHMIYADGISYLEIAGLYAQGLAGDGTAWGAAVNSYWSPLISWLCAMAMAAGVPEYWHISLLHLFNYLALLGSFWVLEGIGGLLPEHRALVWLRWSILAWAGFRMHTLRMISPDHLATLCFLAALLVAGRLWNIFAWKDNPLSESEPTRNEPKLLQGAALGALLAAAYFAKTALLVLAPALLLLLYFGRPAARKAVAAAAVVLMMLLTPWLLALHERTGRWTAGDSGRLNYLWEVQGATRYLYPEGSKVTTSVGQGALRIYAAQPSAQLESEIPVAYPPWYDPSPWYASVHRPWQIGEQLRVLWANSRLTILMWLSGPGALLLLLAARRMHSLGQWATFRQALHQNAVLWLPCVALLGGYLLVFVEGRYVAGALIVLVLVPVTLAATLTGQAGRKLLQLGAVVTVAAYLWPMLLESGTFTWQDLRAGREMQPNPNWMIRAEFARMNLQPGTRVGMVGMAMNADWLRSGRLRVVADLPARFFRSQDLQRAQAIDLEPLERFWRLPVVEQNALLRRMAEAGATVVMADNVPESVLPMGRVPEGWQQLETKVPMFVGGDRIFYRKLQGLSDGPVLARGPAQGK